MKSIQNELNIDISYVDYLSNELDELDDLDKINDEIKNKDSCAIFALLGKYSPKFLSMFNKTEFPPEKYPILILDYSKQEAEKYYTDNNVDLNCMVDTYITSIYAIAINDHMNNVLMDEIDTYKGSKFSLISPETAAIYNSLAGLSAVMTNDVRSSTDIRFKLYHTEISIPGGTLKFYSNNYVSCYLYILKFVDIEYNRQIYSQFTYQIYPRVWNIYDYNNKYYETDFIESPNMKEVDIIGVAFLLDISDYKTSHAFYNYLIGLLETSKANVKGNIKNRRIVLIFNIRKLNYLGVHLILIQHLV